MAINPIHVRCGRTTDIYRAINGPEADIHAIVH